MDLPKIANGFPKDCQGMFEGLSNFLLRMAKVFPKYCPIELILRFCCSLAWPPVPVLGPDYFSKSKYSNYSTYSNYPNYSDYSNYSSFFRTIPSIPTIPTILTIPTIPAISTIPTQGIPKDCQCIPPKDRQASPKGLPRVAKGFPEESQRTPQG